MIASALESIAALLRQADPGLTVGAPGPGAGGLVLWPWRYTAIATIASPPAPPRPGQQPVPRPVTFDLQLLVLPRSASSVVDLGALDRALALLNATPLLRTGTGAIRLTIGSGLAHADLAALFAAAAIPMSIGIELVARMTPA